MLKCYMQNATCYMLHVYRVLHALLCVVGVKTEEGNEPYFRRRASSESWDLKQLSTQTFRIFEPPTQADMSEHYQQY